MPGEQLIQTRADPRLKSSPDRSRRCSFIFLGRFADGWKNQCPTEESGGGGARGREGKKRERGSGREAKGEGSVPGEAGGPHGVVGRRVGWWHLQPPPALVVWGLLAAGGARQSRATAACTLWCWGITTPSPQGLVPPHAQHHSCSPDGSPKSTPWGPPAEPLLLSMETPPHFRRPWYPRPDLGEEAHKAHKDFPP